MLKRATSRNAAEIQESAKYKEIAAASCKIVKKFMLR